MCKFSLFIHTSVLLKVLNIGLLFQLVIIILFQLVIIILIQLMIIILIQLGRSFRLLFIMILSCINRRIVSILQFLTFFDFLILIYSFESF